MNQDNRRSLMFLYAAQTALIIAVTSASIVVKNLDLEVANGKTLHVRKSHLQFATKPGEICKVQVAENEPMYQRVGELVPKVFDCDYVRNSIRYQHNGSPLLSEDVVKLRVSRLLDSETVQETFFLRIHILNSECDVIKLGRRKLQVPTMDGISNPINKDVVQFYYDRLFRTKCEIRVATEKYGFPEVGQLVVRSNLPEKEGEYEPAGMIISDCDDFLLKEIRYQHLLPPTPDIDYIPLHVIITDKRSRYILKQEYHWLPVNIGGAYPNQEPRPSYSNMNVLEVDQFVTTNILSMTMAATDSETENDKLVFNITKRPEQGFIAHIDDESKPIDSFYQKDVGNLKIAYQPPNISYAERETFIVEFIVYDSRFAESRIIQVLLSVRISHTSAPRISWNMGLTMLEGQSRPINKDCLQIVDSDTLSLVRITLAGGLQHGRLFVDEQPGYSFSWADVESNKVIYQHDDSDTTRDHVMFQVSDGFHSTRFKLPIEILPKDDSPPVLVNNVGFEVAEGQIIHIYRFMLEASDQDSSSDYIKYNITSPPRAGQIQKKRDGERAGWEVQKFEQRDLYQGNIFYKHLGDEAFDDSFDFVLIDNSKPYPNVSPLHTATIKITPVDDQPPKAVSEITRSLTVNETDVTFITSEMLNYIDEEEPGSTITYSITSDFDKLESLEEDASNKTDAGHLFYTDDMFMLMKDPTVPHLKMFSQDAINHNKVAYMPPMEDIGLFPLDVHFEYSVSDSHGTKVEGEEFFITVLPVDNQAPSLSISDLFTQEGRSLVLSADDFDVSDPDTIVNQLYFILTKYPKHGIIEKYGRQMAVGDVFRYTDLQEFGIMYTHNGSEAFFDDFTLVATDGHQKSSAVSTLIIIEPIDDEQPVFKHATRLSVNESSSAIISSLHVLATDLDTDDKKLIFEIAGGPQSGRVLLGGKEVRSFTQKDVADGRVEYQHNGEEIGYLPKHDVVSLIVIDREINYDDLQEGLDTDSNQILKTPMETYDLNVTILPVNNRPPNIILGSAIFDCDEGGRHVLNTDQVWATDLDTPQNELVFKISSPEFGVIEDNTPREGYEKQISVPVDSFHLQKLVDGNIFYVQSKHRGIEPTADTFLVSVTDGKHTSAEVPFLVAIIPTNDEPPGVRISNFSCGEGDMYSLSEAVLTVVDMDVPSDEVMISVISPPVHGMLINEMEMKRAKRSSKKRDSDYAHTMHEIDHMSEFSLHDWSLHLVQPAYLHDGTENDHDKFELKISDGKHVYKSEMSVNIVLVNDEKPGVMMNKGLTIELGDTEILSNVVLYATDADSPDTELFYVLYSIPSQGKLQLKAFNEWRTLQIGDSFTEEDVENNLIRYTHSNVLSAKGRDSFRFSVTDGTWTTKRQNFEITIRHKEKSTVHVATGLANVKEGDKIFITTDILSARDGFDRPEDISYEIISVPMYGQIEYISNPFSTISIFSQLDLMSRKIIYRHKSKEDSALDSFTVQAGNGISSQEGVVTIQIESVDIILPTLVLFPSSSNGGKATDSSHIIVFRGASVTINEMVISITDPDTTKDRLRLITTSYPQHGNLLLDHVMLDNSGTHEISLSQLENAEFMYEHNGDESQIDRFSFMVTDGAHSGYILNGQRTLEPTIFNIKIEQLDDTPPRIIVNIPTRSIEALHGISTQYAVYIDIHHLEATDGDSVDKDDEIIFSITEPPSYGMLKKMGDNSKLAPVVEFTMDDLKTRKLMYIVDGKFNVTNDSFVFDVQDDWGNVMMGHRFVMSWTRIELVEKARAVCETQNRSSISVKRFGDRTISSFVGVKIVSLNSAKENHDFTPNSARQIQFDPGVTIQTWHFKVNNDGIRERKEKFKILLDSPINAVLAPQKKELMVTILDAGSKSCKKMSSSFLEYPLGSEKVGRRRKGNTGQHKTNKLKTRKKKSRRRNGKKNAKLAGDQPALHHFQSLSRKTRKYGKLGKGVTVPPSTYFRNKTHRLWRYHALAPITIGEESVPEEGSPLEGIGAPYKYASNDKLINDEPIQDFHEQDTTGRKSRISDPSEADFMIDNDVPIPPDNPRPHAVPQMCTIHMYDRLFYHSASSSLMRCNGAAWVPWAPSKLVATKPLQVPECESDWHRFENRCFYIHLGDAGGQSWNSAQRRCREDFDAQLATIMSKKHMNWIRRKSGRQKLWIGLNKKLGPDWEWTGGGSVVFTNWKRSSRRHTKRSHSSDANCALSTERKRWIAKNCISNQSNAGFVCMKELGSFS